MSTAWFGFCDNCRQAKTFRSKESRDKWEADHSHVEPDDDAPDGDQDDEFGVLAW